MKIKPASVEVFHVNSLLSDLGIFWDFGRELCVGVESPAAGWMTAKSLKCNTESIDS